MTNFPSKQRLVWLCSLAAEISIGISFLLLFFQLSQMSRDRYLNQVLHAVLHSGNLAFFLVSAALYFATAVMMISYNKSLGYFYIARFVLYFTAFLLLFSGSLWT